MASSSTGLALSFGEQLTFGLLAAAIVALWLPQPRRGAAVLSSAWLVLFAGAAASAIWFAFLDQRGLASLVALAALSFAVYRLKLPVAARVVSVVGLLLLAAGLSLHLMPGFANPKVISGEVLTAGAVPYTRYLNFDKTAVGLILLAFGLPRIAAWRQWLEMLRRIAPVMLALIGVVLPLSLLLGHVRFEPALRPHLILWASTNLLFTCTAEEALFRGFIQRSLERWLGGYRLGAACSLAIAALLFGLAHLAGGWDYMLLSTIAGFGYGWAMRRSGRIEGAIVTHFLVNSLHFGFFTYPALAGLQ